MRRLRLLWTRHALTVLVVSLAVVVGGWLVWPSPLGTALVRTAADAGGGDATVGPLFLGGLDGPHLCTASVVASTTENLLITAAHCVAGTGAGMVFAPGYHDGIAPHGSWVVQRAYADPRWRSRQDPAADYAFLAVAPDPADADATGSTNVEATVGGADLGGEPRNGEAVVVTGYAAAATGGRQLRCLGPVDIDRATGHVPTFDCGGFVVGTSGGPWVASEPGDKRSVVGVIGGLHGGGCTPDESFTARFDAATRALLRRAEAVEAAAASGGTVPGDVLPNPGDDGC